MLILKVRILCRDLSASGNKKYPYTTDLKNKKKEEERLQASTPR